MKNSELDIINEFNNIKFETEQNMKVFRFSGKNGFQIENLNENDEEIKFKDLINNKKWDIFKII